MNAADFIFSQPWAMLPSHVAEMIAIADRSMTSRAELDAVLSKAGERLDNTRTVTNRDGVAVIPVRGVISRYANMFSAICGGTSVQVLAQDLRSAVENPAIKAIILEIDSPGGQVSGTGELATQIRAATAVKPVAAYVSNLGASAAYWLASAASEIVVSPSAILGSVGVIATMPRTTADDKTVEFVSSKSPFKRVSTETKEGRAKIQADVDAIADVFIGAVADHRKTTPEKVVSDFGAGGTMIGQAAVDAGMADRLGSLETLISELSTGGPAGKSDFSRLGGAADAGSLDPSAMNLKVHDFFASWFKGGMQETVEIAEAAAASTEPKAEPVVVATASAPVNVDVERYKAEIAKLEAKLAEGAKSEAETWFATQVNAGKATPAEKADILGVYAALPANLMGSYKATVEARKPAKLDVETIPTDAAAAKEFLEAGGFKTLPHATATPDEAEAKASKDMIREMLLATESGKDLAD